MSTNKFKYINYQDYVIYFDDYFDYLRTIKGSLPKDMSDFFCNEDRYMLRKEDTLHNAWIDSMQIKNSYVGNVRQTTLELILLLAHSDHNIKLTYHNVLDIEYQQTPSDLDDKRWADKATDLLTHELSVVSEMRYQHIIGFDRDVWLSLTFETFSFSLSSKERFSQDSSGWHDGLP